MNDFTQLYGSYPQQYFDEDQFHGNASTAVGTSWSVTTSMIPQHPQSAPRPLPGQPWGQAGILQDDMVSDWYRIFSHCGDSPAFVILLVRINECCWQSSSRKGLGGFVPTCRERCCSRSTGRPTVRSMSH